ncbi:unnamed protein product, partial [Meganyctiphanes norvegica]
MKDLNRTSTYHSQLTLNGIPMKDLNRTSTYHSQLTLNGIPMKDLNRTSTYHSQLTLNGIPMKDLNRTSTYHSQLTLNGIPMKDLNRTSTYHSQLTLNGLPMKDLNRTSTYHSQLTLNGIPMKDLNHTSTYHSQLTLNGIPMKDLNHTSTYHSQLTLNGILTKDINCTSTYNEIFILEFYYFNPRTQRSNYVANTFIKQNYIENHLPKHIKSNFSTNLNNINVTLNPEGNDGKAVLEKHLEPIQPYWSYDHSKLHPNNNKYTQRDQESIHAYGPYTDYSKLHPNNDKYAKSPGSAVQHSKLVVLMCTVVMFLGPTISAGASASVIAPLFKDNDLNKFKVIYTLNTVVQPALLEVYQLYKRFDDTKNIKDHLINDLHMSVHSYRDKFDRTMRDVIENTDNSGKDYDISLLVKCLRVLSRQYEPRCENRWRDTDQLEFRCQKLVDKRNETFHSFSGITIPEMRNEINAIENLLKEMLMSLEARYPRESRKINKLKTETLDKISYIRKHPLGNSDIKTYILQLLKYRIPSYKTKCKRWEKLKILDFLLGSSTFHDIRLLYTETIVEKSHKLARNTPVNCKDILNLATPFTILLIDSEAGGGKTTLFRYVINDWGEGGTMMSTTDYDFIFPMAFRDPNTNCVKDLICNLVSSVGTIMDPEYINNCITDPSLKIMFFCDGFDEKNANSLQLFNEICELNKKYSHIRVIVTTRPESVREFYHSHSRTHPIEHLKLLGIHESKRGDFLVKYHDEMIAAGISTQSSGELLQFYSSCSDRHKELYRLPINLVILAYLWGQDPAKAQKIKSAAGLYTELVEILNKKLISRILESHPDVLINLKGDMDTLKDHIESFKDKVYNESLTAVRFDRIFIDDNGVRNLRKFCTDKALPFLEMKGAYLLSKLEWETVNDLKEVLELPHKGFLDYFSAKCIESKLMHMSNNEKDKTLPKCQKLVHMPENRVKKIILDNHNEEERNLPKYQNILQLLGGILALKDVNLVEQHGQDIIDLLIETGVSNNSQWMDIYMDLNVNPTAAEKFGKLIAPHLKIDDLNIKNGDVEVLSNLLQYCDIKKVTFYISGNVMPAQLPALLNVLTDKNCKVTIKKITEAQVHFWDTLIRLNDQININEVTFDISGPVMPAQLPALLNVLADKKCKVTINITTEAQVHIWKTALELTNQINLNEVTVTFDISGTVMPAQLPALLNVLTDKQCKVTIKITTEAQVHFWYNLIGVNDQMNIYQVTFDISGPVMPTQLPALLNVLTDKNCKVTIKEIKEDQHKLWNSAIAQNNKIIIKKVESDINITKHDNMLPFLSQLKSIGDPLDSECRLNPSWRDLHPAPDMRQCDMSTLWTAVTNISKIPTSVKYLYLAVLRDEVTHQALDPGYADIKQHCTGL